MRRRRSVRPDPAAHRADGRDMLGRVTELPADNRSFTAARGPARFAACEEDGVPGVEHAAGARGTLCGIPDARITVYRRLFVPRRLPTLRGRRSCGRCRDIVRR
ncbi:hypothetical protein CG736_07440 [Kitasatospora sp. CB02891]|nr:hypothetical protein CG736_07440 [Kitasatospora sp. CB02891]